MPSLRSNDSPELGFSLAGQGSAATGIVSESAGLAAARPSSLQALLEQVNQQVDRLSRSGGGQFDLEWGADGERLQVQVAMRDGHWRVEFRTSNAELGRFLEREWQTQEARTVAGREAEVAFQSDGSGDQRHRREQSSEDLSAEESRLLSELFRARRAAGGRVTTTL